MAPRETAYHKKFRTSGNVLERTLPFLYDGIPLLIDGIDIGWGGIGSVVLMGWDGIGGRVLIGWDSIEGFCY